MIEVFLGVMFGLVGAFGLIVGLCKLSEKIQEEKYRRKYR